MRKLFIQTDQNNLIFSNFIHRFREELFKDTGFTIVDKIEEGVVTLNFSDTVFDEKDKNIFNISPFYYQSKISIARRKFNEHTKLYLPLPVIPPTNLVKTDKYSIIQNRMEVVVGVLGSIDAGIFVKDFVNRFPEYAGRIKFVFIQDLDDFYKILPRLDFYYMISNSLSDNLFALQASANSVPIAVFHKEIGFPTYFCNIENFEWCLEELLELCISDKRNRIRFLEIVDLQRISNFYHHWDMKIARKLILLLQ